jgi:hypothetical protein
LDKTTRFKETITQKQQKKKKKRKQTTTEIQVKTQTGRASHALVRVDQNKSRRRTSRSGATDGGAGGAHQRAVGDI